MNAFYNITDAAIALENVAQERKRTSKAQQLSTIKIDEMKVYERTHPDEWTVVEIDDIDGDIQEIVFNCQGILQASDLPPMQGGRENLQKKVMYLRQQVDIIGLNSESFSMCLQNLQALNGLLSRAIPGNILGRWQPDVSGETSIPASNRYFTRQRDTRGDSEVPFTAFEDPRGILQSLGEDNFIHSDDNVVSYYRAVNSEAGRKKYIATSPANFKKGDIVELQLTVTAVRVKNDQVRMLIKLRALTLLNSEFTEAANARRMGSFTKPQVIENKLKRKVGYTEDSESGEDSMTICRPSSPKRIQLDRRLQDLSLSKQ